LRILSRAGRPADTIGPYVDDRRLLGVAIGAIALTAGRGEQAIRVHLEQTALPGWHAIEDDFRWTSGDAMLPLGANPCLVPMRLALEIRAAGPYLADDAADIHNAPAPAPALQLAGQNHTRR
jgi:hypothetical protein